VSVGRLHLCPVCQRSFEEAGFCPFDRAPLNAPPSYANEKETLLSTAMPVAQPPPTNPDAYKTKPALPHDHKTSPYGVGGLPGSGAASEPPHKTDIDPRRTFPMPGASTQEVTSTRNRPAPAASAVRTPPPAAPVSQIRAVSASEDAASALAAFRAHVKESDYDKLVGETLDGRYLVERKIGEGGMGVVFSARHAVIERPLAIKVLKREVMRDTATIKRFVKEAQAASRIWHPNIVDVTDYGTTPDGMTFSVME
jgi:hypothetical protein